MLQWQIECLPLKRDRLLQSIGRVESGSNRTVRNHMHVNVESTYRASADTP